MAIKSRYLIVLNGHFLHITHVSQLRNLKESSIYRYLSHSIRDRHITHVYIIIQSGLTAQQNTI